MNFLVVDDERYMLKNIQTQLQRCKFSVTQIFTAVSAAQAREIISNSHVDIILCDIEMPQESGLELLLWVNKHHPRITNIVLTCYADFSYIQQALRLNVADYLVKPIPQEELQAAIQKAIDRINQSRQMEKHSSYGKYWAENESKLYENFWREVLQGTVPAEPEALQREATSRNLFLQMETRYIPILVCIYNRLGNTPQENAKNQGAVKELVRNTFVEVSQQGIVIETEWERLMCILPVDSRQNIESSFFLDCCERMAGSAQTYFSCNLYCYIGESCAVADLNAVYLRFNEYSRHDVVKKHAVLLGSSIPKDTTGPLDLNILAMLLLEGEYVEARLEAETLLRREGATEEYLHFFYHNFVQILGNVLKKQDISYAAFSEMEPQILPPAFDSQQSLCLWATSMIDRLIQCRKETKAATEVKNYIDNHLDGKLTRELLAQKVYLNPDYLNRLFKQETGMSIHDYIIERRIEMAKELLQKTKLKTSAIALNVGYKNFSQFSEAFRSKTGISPREYRRTHAQL